MRIDRRLWLAGILAASFLAVAMPGLAQGAAPSFLRGEFWTDVDLPPRDGESYPLPDSEAAGRVLDEAAWVFSGMVDGFAFDWTPENKGRQVKESFALESLATISHGDPRLVPGATVKTATRLGAWIDFRPDAADQRSLESSLSPTWKNAQGVASISRSRGFSGRREAYVAAAKAAIEAWARSTEPVRPREIKGRLVFANVPLVGIEDDAWKISLRVRIEILELRRWSFF